MIDLNKLKAAAEAAKAYQPDAIKAHSFGCFDEEGVFYELGNVCARIYDRDENSDGSSADDALLNHIIAASPDAVLELIAMASATAPQVVADEQGMQTIRERDCNADIADRLANGIAEHFGAVIGEHSSANCPWIQALDLLNTEPEFIDCAGSKRAALAAAPVQAQEPVAWSYEALMDVNGDVFWMKALTEQDPKAEGGRVRNVKALCYTTPDERAQGVRITPMEILSYGAIKTGSPTSAKEENAKSIEDGRVKVTQCVFATSPTNPGVLVSAPMLGPERAAFNDLVAKYPVKSRQDAEDFFVFGIQHQKMAAPAAQGDAKEEIEKLLKSSQLHSILQKVDDACNADDFGKRARAALEELCEWIYEYRIDAAIAAKAAS